MAKTLILVRHAKSSWEHFGLGDHERTLLKTGIERTKRMARFLSARGIKPDLIVSSHAVRARETAGLLAGPLNYPEKDILIEQRLYYQGAAVLYDLILSLPDDKETVMLVGHNPAMTQLANLFLDEKLDILPTTGVLCFGFDIVEWAGLPMVKPQRNFYVTPKMLT